MRVRGLPRPGALHGAHGEAVDERADGKRRFGDAARGCGAGQPLPQPVGSGPHALHGPVPLLEQAREPGEVRLQRPAVGLQAAGAFGVVARPLKLDRGPQHVEQRFQVLLVRRLGRPQQVALEHLAHPMHHRTETAHVMHPRGAPAACWGIVLVASRWTRA